MKRDTYAKHFEFWYFPSVIFNFKKKIMKIKSNKYSPRWWRMRIASAENIDTELCTYVLKTIPNYAYVDIRIYTNVQNKFQGYTCLLLAYLSSCVSLNRTWRICLKSITFVLARVYVTPNDSVKQNPTRKWVKKAS